MGYHMGWVCRIGGILICRTTHPLVRISLILVRIAFGATLRATAISAPNDGKQAMRNLIWSLAAITLQFAMALPDAAAATVEYSFTPIEFPGAESTDVHGINDAGVIVGSYSLADKIHGFVFDGAAFTTIDFPNAVGTSARGINDQGQIVGRFFLDDRAMLGGGFLFNGDSYEAINFPGASSTTAFDINNAGDIVGGYSETPGHNRGFTFDGASFTSVEYPGAGSSNFSGANNVGMVVGGFSDAGIVLSRSEGFVYDGVNFEVVDIPGARFTEPLDINDEGVIVGWFTHEFLGGTKGFILDEDGQTNVNVPGSLLTYVRGINNNRDIVGTFIDSNLEKHSYLGTAVPEPSSLCLLLSACMGAVCPRRLLRSRVNRPGSRH